MSHLNGPSQGSQVWHPLTLMNGTSPSFLLEASRRWYHITGIKSLMWQNHHHSSPCLTSSVAWTRSKKVTGSEVRRSDSMDPGLSHGLKRSNGSIGYIRKS